MHILLTNDDGVDAPGIRALLSEISKIAIVTVVAPDRERSATGHSITFFDPLRVWTIREEANYSIYSSNGSPSDCVLLALDIIQGRPDFIIAGINRGGNMGDDITYSGTVSAVMEGVIHGIPGFAISLNTFEHGDYLPAARFARVLTNQLISKKFPHLTFLNVNVPHIPEEDIKGVIVTRQGHSIYRERLEKRMDPRGRTYYWVGGEMPLGREEEGTDFKAVAEGKISITPLQLDLTHYRWMDEIKGWGLTNNESQPKTINGV